MPGRPSWFDKVLKPDSDKIAAAFGKLEKFLAADADRAERRRVEQFAAYRWNGSGLSQDMVRDISSSGLFLETGDRWQPGTILTLTLQREGLLDLDPARRITTQVRVVRCGQDGVGLSFLWAKDDPESRQWERLLESLISQTRPADMQNLVRMVDAFAFLGRICTGGAEEIGEWVRTRASSHKIQNAVSIALKAENLLGRESNSLRLDPQAAVHILDVGSSTDEEWLHGYWAGLLITSADGEANLQLVDLFSQLTTIPLRILTVVCTRANKTILESGDVAAQPLACHIDELASTVGARVPQMERELETLCGLQLIAKKRSMSGPALLASNEIYITPTSRGLELFALCNGNRGTLQDFYFADFPETMAMRN